MTLTMKKSMHMLSSGDIMSIDLFGCTNKGESPSNECQVRIIEFIF